MTIGKAFALALVLAFAMSSRVLAIDSNGCLQSGDRDYNPKLPCETPTGPSGQQWTPEQLSDHHHVACAINDPNYGGQLIAQCDEALRASVTN